MPTDTYPDQCPAEAPGSSTAERKVMAYELQLKFLNGQVDELHASLQDQASQTALLHDEYQSQLAAMQERVSVARQDVQHIQGVPMSCTAQAPLQPDLQLTHMLRIAV